MSPGGDGGGGSDDDEEEGEGVMMQRFWSLVTTSWGPKDLYVECLE